MNVPRRYVRTATVLTIALATGHLMQNGDAIAARLGLQGESNERVTNDPAIPMTQIAALPQPRVGAGKSLDFAPGVAEMTPTDRQSPALYDPASIRMAALDTADIAAPNPVSAAVPQPSTVDCALRLGLAPEAAAMVALTISAPCATDSDVQIDHSGLTFTGRTDHSGDLLLLVPAMQTRAGFTVALADGQSAQAEIDVPELAGYDRAAVSWRGNAAIELHAFEYGAGYGDNGHVWYGNPRSTKAEIGRAGGFMVRFGDPLAQDPRLTEIYTFPAGDTAASGKIRLTVEAEVTPTSCGSMVAGHTIETIGGAAPRTVDVSLSMPDCDAVGDFLVMSNLFETVKIASD